MKKLVRSVAAVVALSGIGFEAMSSNLYNGKTELVNSYDNDQPKQKNNPNTSKKLAEIATGSTNMPKQELGKKEPYTPERAKHLNNAALSIFGMVEESGYRIVGYIPADEAAKPDAPPFPVIIVSNEEECGGAFYVSEDMNNPDTLVAGMTYSGKLENITDQSKVNGEEMYNGKIQHVEGSLIEEATLDKSAELIAKLTSLACWSYHEEKNNKTR